MRAHEGGEGRASARDIHLHLLNTPDIALWATPPERLRVGLKDVADRLGLSLTVTEGNDASAVTPALREADVVIGFRLPTQQIRELDRLRWIHLISAGVEHLLPLDWLPRRIVLSNSSGLHAELAGEYGCCALLMLNIGVPRHATNQRLGGWERVFNSPICGKTVVLVGVGAIGGSVAMHAKRLGLRVIGVRKTRRPHRYVDEIFGPDDLPKLLPQADFVVVTAPLTPETRGMIGAKELDLLRPTAGLVNMSRAALVDYDVLGAKLERGELRAAVVDVCYQEPLPADSPFRQVKHLIITPHISSDPADYVDRTVAFVAENLERFVVGRPLHSRVNRTLGY